MLNNAIYLLLSSDQTLLWLPYATETPLSPNCFATAASLHAGWAQAQNVHVLAQYWQIDTIQEVKTTHQRRKLWREGPEGDNSIQLVPDWPFYNSPFSFLLIATTDIPIYCIDDDDYNEEKILLWKHFIGWLTIRLEEWFPTLNQTGSGLSLNILLQLLHHPQWSADWYL